MTSTDKVPQYLDQPGRQAMPFRFSLLKGKKNRVRTGSGQSQGRVEMTSQPGAINEKIITALASGPLSKAGIANSLDLGGVTGYLNRAVRELLAEGRIEYTVPEKPNSRFQKYRLIK